MEHRLLFQDFTHVKIEDMSHRFDPILKSCPLCGSRALWLDCYYPIQNRGTKVWYVLCRCGVKFERGYDIRDPDGKQKHARVWNRRVKTQSVIPSDEKKQTQS